MRVANRTYQLILLLALTQYLLVQKAAALKPKKMTLGGVHFYRVHLCVGAGLGLGQNTRSGGLWSRPVSVVWPRGHGASGPPALSAGKARLGAWAPLAPLPEHPVWPEAGECPRRWRWGGESVLGAESLELLTLEARVGSCPSGPAARGQPCRARGGRRRPSGSGARPRLCAIHSRQVTGGMRPTLQAPGTRRSFVKVPAGFTRSTGSSGHLPWVQALERSREPDTTPPPHQPCPAGADALV